MRKTYTAKNPLVLLAIIATVGGATAAHAQSTTIFNDNFATTPSIVSATNGYHAYVGNSSGTITATNAPNQVSTEQTYASSGFTPVPYTAVSGVGEKLTLNTVASYALDVEFDGSSGGTAAAQTNYGAYLANTGDTLTLALNVEFSSLSSNSTIEIGFYNNDGTPGTAVAASYGYNANIDLNDTGASSVFNKDAGPSTSGNKVAGTDTTHLTALGSAFNAGTFSGGASTTTFGSLEDLALTLTRNANNSVTESFFLNGNLVSSATDSSGEYYNFQNLSIGEPESGSTVYPANIMLTDASLTYTMGASAATPEPAALALIPAGLLPLIFALRRKYTARA